MIPPDFDTPNAHQERGDIRQLGLFMMLGTTLDITLSSTICVFVVGCAVGISYAANLLNTVIYNT